QPQRCVPPFKNIAFNLEADATNTCGSEGPEEYCLRSPRQSCKNCDANDPDKAHPSRYMTDSKWNPTWWQSQTLNKLAPGPVNLTFHLGRAYEITYIRMTFQSIRPESFAIYKRTSKDGAWVPLQYFSSSCESTYGHSSRELITIEDETKALCTERFSDMYPYSGGNVVFSTLEGRPSAWRADQNKALQVS
ncbi:hypothetical protein CAPTEDRAFT_45697, partial [Capitella teleta]